MVFILIQLKNDKTTCQMNKEAHASVEIGQSIYHLHSLSECWSVLFSLYPLFCWSQVVCHLHSLSCQNIAVYCFSCIHVLSSFGEHVFLVLYHACSHFVQQHCLPGTFYLFQFNCLFTCCRHGLLPSKLGMPVIRDKTTGEIRSTLPQDEEDSGSDFDVD